MEIVLNSPLTVFDGAHNASSIDAVLRAVPVEGRLITVFSSSTLHDGGATAARVAEASTSVHFAPMAHARALEADELQQGFVGRANAVAHRSVKDAIQAAIEAAAPSDTLLVTGSFYLLAEAKDALGSILDLTGTAARL